MAKTACAVASSKGLTRAEVATGVAQAAIAGFVPRGWLLRLTLVLSLVLAVLLHGPLGWAAVPAALVFARLAALDLTTYTLADVYTLPLLAVGLAHAVTAGRGEETAVLLLVLAAAAWLLRRFPGRVGVGEGDLKLFAAMAAFLSLPGALWALAAGSFLWLPVACVKPKVAVPFGVPMLLGWVVIVCCPHLPNWLVSTIP